MSEKQKSHKSREELEKEGWSQASLTGGDHLKRTLEMYRELGFEVYLEEVDPKDCGQCTVCYESGNETIYRIYTRSKMGDDA